MPARPSAAPKPAAKGKAAPKPQPKAKPGARAKAKPAPKRAARRVRMQQLASASARQKQRRQALSDLNALSADMGSAAAPLSLRRASPAAVEQRVRLLQRRSPAAAFAARLQ